MYAATLSFKQRYVYKSLICTALEDSEENRKHRESKTINFEMAYSTVCLRVILAILEFDILRGSTENSTRKSDVEIDEEEGNNPEEVIHH